MHSGQHIKTANHQAPLDLDKLAPNTPVVLTPIGKPAGSEVRTRVTGQYRDSVIIDGHTYHKSQGSLVRYNNELHTLDVAAA